MEPLKFNHSGPGSTFHIEDFPDSVKVLEVTGDSAGDLGDMALHAADLKTALRYLESINMAQDFTAQTALFDAALVRYLRCFQNSRSRGRLNADVIYAEDAEALESFRFLEDLRNKQIVHDENPFTQCLVGAVLNQPIVETKIAKVVNLIVEFIGLSPDTFNNLHLLCSTTLSWVEKQYDSLAIQITRWLENFTYSELETFPVLTYSRPDLTDVSRTRRTSRSPK